MKPKMQLIESHWTPDGTVTLICESKHGSEIKVRGVRPNTLRKADTLTSHGHRLDLAECRAEGFFKARWGSNQQWF